jgi:hypothetical protein
MNKFKQIRMMQSKPKVTGSMMEGGNISYDPPKRYYAGELAFNKLRDFASNQSLYNKMSLDRLKDYAKQEVKRNEMSSEEAANILEVKKMNLPWKQFKNIKQ